MYVKNDNLSVAVISLTSLYIDHRPLCCFSSIVIGSFISTPSHNRHLRVNNHNVVGKVVLVTSPLTSKLYHVANQVDHMVNSNTPTKTIMSD
ncbi:hypothetical protein Hanom_Chr11g01042461 [Helianthus anomalus]